MSVTAYLQKLSLMICRGCCHVAGPCCCSCRCMMIKASGSVAHSYKCIYVCAYVHYWRCRGCIDLVHMRCMLWPRGAADDGRVFDDFPIARVDEGGGGVLEESWAAHSAAARGIVTAEVVAQAVRLRQELCYSAADAAAADGDDGGVGDACISSDGCLSPASLMASLRRSCCSRACMPGTYTHCTCALTACYVPHSRRSAARYSLAKQGRTAAA